RFQLTDELSQRMNHQWRSEETAILVGFKTAFADNPQLTNRYSKGNQPLRIALDRNLKLPTTHHLFNGEQPTWIINQNKNERNGPLQFVQLDFENEFLNNLLHELFLAGKNSLIVEGGAQLLNSFIAENLWDEARIFETPKLLKTGIDAPALRKEHLISETLFAADTLKIYRPKSSS
ncbi:MAG: RibD family protein, partial [Chitinophagaceae bacterium]|nr:RibD family protein [Chitinophagaceae bacterium]